MNIKKLNKQLKLLLETQGSSPQIKEGDFVVCFDDSVVGKKYFAKVVSVVNSLLRIQPICGVFGQSMNHNTITVNCQKVTLGQDTLNLKIQSYEQILSTLKAVRDKYLKPI